MEWLQRLLEKRVNAKQFRHQQPQFELPNLSWWGRQVNAYEIADREHRPEPELRRLLRRKYTGRETDPLARDLRHAGEAPGGGEAASGNRAPPLDARRRNETASRWSQQLRETPLFLRWKKPYLRSFKPRGYIFLFLQARHAKDE